MSTTELRRAGVLARVAAGTLKLGSAAALMEVSYRQAKRLYRRYRAEGAKGLKHAGAGRPSHRATDTTRRERVLTLIREKYSGGIEARFGPTLAAEHLASEDGVTVDHETLRRWMLVGVCGAGRGNAVRIGAAGSGRRTLASWCSSMAAFIRGLKIAARRAVCSRWWTMRPDAAWGASGAGDNLGGRRDPARVDRALRDSAGALHGWEKCLAVGCSLRSR